MAQEIVQKSPSSPSVGFPRMLILAGTLTDMVISFEISSSRRDIKGRIWRGPNVIEVFRPAKDAGRRLRDAS